MSDNKDKTFSSVTLMPKNVISKTNQNHKSKRIELSHPKHVKSQHKKKIDQVLMKDH